MSFYHLAGPGMLSRWHLCVTVAITALVAACGGGDSLGPPEEPFPDVGGSYLIDGGFDGLTRTEAVFVGTLILTQASRQSGSLGGTLSFTATIAGDVLTAADVPLVSATVTSSAVISFRLASAAPGANWTFSGTRTGNTIRGRHTLTDGTDSFSGDWVATIGSGPTTGSLSITSSTTGAAPDPDGYTLAVDGTDRGFIGTSGTVTVPGLIPGSHTVGLAGLASNCVAEGANPRQAVVTAGATTTVSFVIGCPAAPSSTGTVRVTTTTTGPQPDPDGYTATLDRATSLAIPTAGTVSFAGVLAGSHGMVLSGVATNCTVADGSSRTVSVTGGATSEVSYQVTCTAPTASGLALVSGDGQSGRVTDQLPAPLVVRAIDNAGSPVPGVTINWTVTGGGSVNAASTQTDVAGQASVTRTLGSTAGPQTTVAAIPGLTGPPVTFTHTAVAGSAASVVKVSGDNQNGNPGQVLSQPVVIRILDAWSNPVRDHPVTWEVRAGGGSVDPVNPTTDAEGRANARWTLGSAGANSLVAVASGSSITGNPVTFTATAVAPLGYNVQLRFLSPLTSAQRQAFDDAEARWEAVISGEVPDIQLIAAAGDCGTGSPEMNELIDDLVILVTVEEIDGPGGILGGGGPCYLRTAGLLPHLGRMRFDVADLEFMEASGTLSDVILHEMGHVLGIGLLWELHALLAGGGGADPHFTGTRAVAAFDAVGGTFYTLGEKVPVETTGGPGTADVHWRESVMGHELMTGFIFQSPNPLSIVTIQSLSDQGYSVNTAQADPYTLTAALRAARGRPLLSLGDDRLRVPLRLVDPSGRVTRIIRR